MKKFLTILLSVFCLTGCTIGSDNMENITIYTSIYPIEYITHYLYSDSATIYNIYPDGVNPIIHNYTLNNKQIKDYSNGDLFIYNSLLSIEKDEEPSQVEIDYAIEMRKNNSKIKLIDAASNLSYNYGIEELWLNPSNLLAMAQNIVDTLKEYITNPYLIKEIDDNYGNLKLELTEVDTSLKNLYENSNYQTLVVTSDVFEFLEDKYKFNVISLDTTNNALQEKTIADVSDLITNGDVKYIYAMKDEELNDEVKRIIDKNDVTILYLNPLLTISESERNNKDDYLSIINSNIQELEKELYK